MRCTDSVPNEILARRSCNFDVKVESASSGCCAARSMRLWLRLQTKSAEVDEEDAVGEEEEVGVVVLDDAEDEAFDRVLFETSLSVIMLNLAEGLTIRV